MKTIDLIILTGATLGSLTILTAAGLSLANVLNGTNAVIIGGVVLVVSLLALCFRV